jgi:hypothetical protein
MGRLDRRRPSRPPSRPAGPPARTDPRLEPFPGRLPTAPSFRSPRRRSTTALLHGGRRPPSRAAPSAPNRVRRLPAPVRHDLAYVYPGMRWPPGVVTGHRTSRHRCSGPDKMAAEVHFPIAACVKATDDRLITCAGMGTQCAPDRGTESADQTGTSDRQPGRANHRSPDCTPNANGGSARRQHHQIQLPPAQSRQGRAWPPRLGVTYCN